MEIFHKEKIVGSLPIKPLADLSPEYSQDHIKKGKQEKLKSKEIKINPKEASVKIISSPNCCSKEWLFRSMIPL